MERGEGERGGRGWGVIGGECAVGGLVELRVFVEREGMGGYEGGWGGI